MADDLDELSDPVISTDDDHDQDNEKQPSEYEPLEHIRNQRNRGHQPGGNGVGKNDAEGSIFEEEEPSSSEDELYDNTVGTVPMRWYEGYDHIGYDKQGKRIQKKPRSDAEKLAALVDPEGWRKIYDEKNDRYITLTDQELGMIARLRSRRMFASSDQEQEDEVIAWSGPVLQTPAYPLPTEPKRRFTPSKHEAARVVKLVRAIRKGWKVFVDDNKQRSLEEEKQLYDLWIEEQTKSLEDMTKAERTRELMRAGAPKLALPDHKESYNPPEEYLPTEEEAMAWKDAHELDRETNFLPQKFDAFRHIPLYANNIKERFERCLDLYLAARVVKKRLQIDPEKLLPELPKPSSLRPFPTGLSSTIYPKLPGYLRSISMHPSGQWLLIASTKGSVCIADIYVGRIAHVWHFEREAEQDEMEMRKLQTKTEGGDINSDEVNLVVTKKSFLLNMKLEDETLESAVAVNAAMWCPRSDTLVFGAAYRNHLYIVDASEILGGSDFVCKASKALLQPLDDEIEKRKAEAQAQPELLDSLWDSAEITADTNEKQPLDENASNNTKHKKKLKTRKESSEANPTAPRQYSLVIKHRNEIQSIHWHHKGDYIASVSRDHKGSALLLHRLSRQESHKPFHNKTSSTAQIVRFHPTRPFLFLASQHHIRVYNLAEQKVVKKLTPGCKFISSLDVHPSGDHLLIGSYDRRTCWMDMDLGEKPYRVLRNHTKAIRSCGFHKKLPLFADVSDDLSSHVYHGQVFDDLSKNAMIVPVKILRNFHSTEKLIGIVDMQWHPELPWLITAGADNLVHVMTDI